MKKKKEKQVKWPKEKNANEKPSHLLLSNSDGPEARLRVGKVE